MPIIDEEDNLPSRGFSSCMKEKVYEGDAIAEFIEDFRGKHGEYFFLNGGCYIFAKILQVNFGGFIYSNIDHCILKKDQLYYDIKGCIGHLTALDKGYMPIDGLEEMRYKTYENLTN